MIVRAFLNVQSGKWKTTYNLIIWYTYSSNTWLFYYTYLGRMLFIWLYVYVHIIIIQYL